MRYKSLLIISVLFISVSFSFAQRKNNQISLRVGEPMGISYNRFISPKSSLEFIVGTASSEWNPRYYKASFKSYDDLDNYYYNKHHVDDILYVQARYLSHKSINWDQIPGTFEWYWGAGILWKTATVQYFYKDPGVPIVVEKKTKTDIDFGPEGILGIEYTLKEIPLSLFFEASLFIEGTNRHGSLRGFSAIGLRYHF